MGRRVWSDPDVAEWTERFVTAADEVWRLQNASAPECRFFRRMVLGDEAPTRGTLQGTYVFAPSGELLARRNSSSAEAIIEILETAWTRWLELPESARRLASRDLVAPGFRWEELRPDDGLVLRRTARDLPDDGDPAREPGERFNRDAVWFSRDEARALFAADPAPGARHVLPETLTQRLSCLVFVDNVRGQTIPYHPSEDAGSELWSEVSRVENDRVTLRFGGHTAAASDGTWLFGETSDWTPPEGKRWPHSIATRIRGTATFDTRAGRFVAFDLLALGERRGRTINHGRPPDEPGGIGFVCELAPTGWRVPPTFLDAYGVAWASPPR